MLEKIKTKRCIFLEMKLLFKKSLKSLEAKFEKNEQLLNNKFDIILVECKQKVKWKLKFIKRTPYKYMF